VVLSQLVAIGLLVVLTAAEYCTVLVAATSYYLWQAVQYCTQLVAIVAAS
jgi:hypothetical protein